MDTNTILILVAIGIFAGTVSGFVGVGGGIVIVPLLIYALGMSQHEAQGTTLFILLPPVGLLAVYNYWKADTINWNVGIVVALAFVIGGYIGSKLSLKLSPGIIKLIFGVIMAYVSVRMFMSGINSFSNES